MCGTFFKGGDTQKMINLCYGSAIRIGTQVGFILCIRYTHTDKFFLFYHQFRSFPPLMRHPTEKGWGGENIFQYIGKHYHKNGISITLSKKQ